MTEHAVHPSQQSGRGREGKGGKKKIKKRLVLLTGRDGASGPPVLCDPGCAAHPGQQSGRSVDEALHRGRAWVPVIASAVIGVLLKGDDQNKMIERRFVRYMIE